MFYQLPDSRKAAHPKATTPAASGPTNLNPTAPPKPGRAKGANAELRKPLEEAMDRNDWKKACELYVEKIKLADRNA